MCDIVALAFQTDRTRIATLLLTSDALIAEKPKDEKASGGDEDIY